MVKKTLPHGKEAKVSQVKKSKPVNTSTRSSDQGKVTKRPVVGTQGLKNKRPPKSSAGFSLYSSDSEVEDRAINGASAISKATEANTGGEVKKPGRSYVHIVRGDEVVSQMQLEAGRLVEAGLEAGIVVPTAGSDSLTDKSLSEDILGVSTPFNKRLISSTPDPEKLREAENRCLNSLSQESWQHSNPGLNGAEMAPQMIPERDTGHTLMGSVQVKTVLASRPADYSTIKPFTLIPELFEKLKHQRQQNPSQHLEAKAWEHQLQPYKAESKDKPTPGTGENDYMPFEMVESLKADIQESELRAKWVPQSEPPGGPSNGDSVNQSKGERSWNVLKMNPDFDPKTTPRSFRSHLSGKSLPISGSENCKPKTLKKDVSVSSSKVSEQRLASQNSSSSSDDSHKQYKTSSAKKPASQRHPKPPPNSALIKAANEKAKQDKQSNPNSNLAPKSNCSSSEADSMYQSLSQDMSNQSRTSDHSNTSHPSSSHKQSHTSAFKPISNDGGKTDEHLKNVVRNLRELMPDLDLSSDTCDEEVNQAISNNGSHDDPKHVNIQGSETPLSEGNNLSQVIEFLKTEAFAVRKEVAFSLPHDSKPAENGSSENVMSKHSVEDREEIESQQQQVHKDYSSDSGMVSHVVTPGRPLHTSQPSDLSDPVKKDSKSSQIAEDLINRYIINKQKSVEDFENVEKDVVSSFKETDHAKGSDNPKEVADQNQNSNNDNNNKPRRPQNLEFLDKMADPYLRETACRLAFKAAAIRDIELRDLIDDMIYYTDAALAHEDARFHSSKMFFSEENSKLKKRCQTVNRQLDARERQGGNGLGQSNNDVLHLERKVMYLQQEKDRLDSQVTGLLEEKARWLITQQDLVRTVSIKDHEILKLEEKHQEERMRLHRDLDNATKGSQGVHYKLAVADRELANLEDRVKGKDAELREVKERLHTAEKDCLQKRNDLRATESELANLEERLKENPSTVNELKAQLHRTDTDYQNCEERSKLKDKQIERLNDLVDTLKMGVNQVLSAYESTASGPEAREYERQGMESLRMMTNPDMYIEPANGQATSTRQTGEEISRTTYRSLPHQEDFNRRTNSSRPPPPPPTNTRRKTRVDAHLLEVPRRDRGQKLTQQEIEEHNQRLPPVNKALWRSYEHVPDVTLVDLDDQYCSDSEIVVTTRDSRRRSNRRTTRTPSRDPEGHRSGSRSRRPDEGGQRWKKRVCFCAESYPSDENGEVEMKCRCRTLRDNEDFPQFSKNFRSSSRDREYSSGRSHQSRERSRERSLRRDEDRTFQREEDRRLHNEDRLHHSVPEPSGRGRGAGRNVLSESLPNRRYTYRDTDQPTNPDPIPDPNPQGYYSYRGNDQASDETLEAHSLARSDLSRDSPRAVVDVTHGNVTSVFLRSDDRSRRSDRDQGQRSYMDKEERSKTPRFIDLGEEEIEHRGRRRGNTDDEEETCVKQTKNSGSGSSRYATAQDNTPSYQVDDCSKGASRGTVNNTDTMRQSRPKDTKFVSLDGDSEGSQSCTEESYSRPTQGQARVDGHGSSGRTRQSRAPLERKRPDRDSDYDSPERRGQSRIIPDRTRLSRNSPERTRQTRNSPDRTRQPRAQTYNSSDKSRSKSRGFDSTSYPEFARNQQSEHLNSTTRNSRCRNKPSRSPNRRRIDDDLDDEDFYRSDFPEMGSDYQSRHERTDNRQSSPRALSDASPSRLATRGSETSYHNDYFQGTELSTSLSSISDDWTRNNNNNDGGDSSGAESFSTGIATLDAKIAHLQAKIDRTKAVFS